jgi:hypothetical protein
LGDDRTWGVRVSGGQVAIACLDTNVAGIALTTFPRGAPVADDQPLVFNDAAETVHEFRIVGKAVGRTEIVAFDPQFRRLASLIISVKAERTVSYGLLRLRDVFRPPAQTEATLVRLMGDVERLYLLQTNTRLIRRRSAELYVKADLGDPISTDGPINPNSIPRKTASEAIRDRIAELSLNDVDRNVVCTWDIDDESTTGFTPELGRLCLVEAQPNKDLETIALAHELGHSFKLDHIFHDEPDLLMNDRPNGTRMTGPDIDRVNSSGV